MSRNAYFVSPDRALRVANDNGPIATASHYLPPQMQTGARRNHLSEMTLFVEEGIVEFMVGGAAVLVTSGGFVRIPADALYAFRNAGDDAARLLSRFASPAQPADSAA